MSDDADRIAELERRVDRLETTLDRFLTATEAVAEAVARIPVGAGPLFSELNWSARAVSDVRSEFTKSQE